MLDTITVKELIEALEDLEPNALIAFSSDYGDHTHTEQVHSIDGNIEKKLITESGYSESGWAVSSSDDDAVDHIYIIN